MSRTQFLLWSLLTAALFAAVTPCALAADNKAQAGLIYGYSVPDAPNTKAFVLSGFKGAAFLTPAYSVGGYFLYSDKQGAPSADEKFRYSLHGIEGAYRMPAGSGASFAALRVGITKVTTNPTGADTTFSPYHYGVVYGYELQVFTWLSIGFEGSYLHVQRGKNSLNGSSVYLDSFNLMNFLVSLQITH